MAVHRQHDAVQLGHALAEPAQDRGVLLGDAEADGVGDVERGRAGVDAGRTTSAMKSGSVRDASSDENSTSSVNDLARRTARAADSQHLVAGHPQLVLHVDVGRRDERVDARRVDAAAATRWRRRCPRRWCGRATRRRSRPRSRPRPDALELAGRRDRETGLDDVDPEPLELARRSPPSRQRRARCRATARRRAAWCRRSGRRPLWMTCAKTSSGSRKRAHLSR